METSTSSPYHKLPPITRALTPLHTAVFKVETPTFSWVMNNPNMEGGKHYVTIFMLAPVANPDKEPILMEPNKCEGR